MDEKYWNQIAENYDREIFDVLAHDAENLLHTRILNVASNTKTASDLGCGIGKFLPILSRNFGRVHAYDISNKCLQQARERCAGLSNIKYIKADLSRRKNRLPKVDFILCVNSLIMPSMSQRSRYFRLISNHLNHGGHLLLVVPSLESALYSRFRLIEWCVRTGLNHGAAVRVGSNGNRDQKNKLLKQGIVSIDNVATKHYLEEELCAILQSLGFALHEVTKIQYDWRTEFNNPPRWMKAPYPWDWLVTAKRR